MILIKGIGWITKNRYGAVLQNRQDTFPDPDRVHAHLCQEAVFQYPVKNFNRFDRVSQKTCAAAALAYYDAHIRYAVDQKRDTGIYGASESGCFDANMAYFSDYITCGRTLARGNLFVYTLPSSPLSEAAIHLGCRGPLMHLTFPDHPLARLLRQAEAALVTGEAPAMLAVFAEEAAALCFYLCPGIPAEENGFDMDAVISAAGSSPNPADTIRRVAAMRGTL